MTNECCKCGHQDHESNMTYERLNDDWYCMKCTNIHVGRVNHPPHYQSEKMEVIEVVEAFNLNFSLGNAIKYILRAGKKDDRITDLKKAQWYLDREINSGLK